MLIVYQLPVSAQTNLVVNGSFEEPDVQRVDFDLFSSSVVPGWTVFKGPDEIEIQDHLPGFDPDVGAGDQFVELDSTASTVIFQDIPTRQGCLYDISFAFSPRPNTPQSDNILRVTWNGVAFPSIAEAGGTATNWTSFTFPDNAADGSETRLEFEDLGTSNRVGTFIDSVTVVESCVDHFQCYRSQGESLDVTVDLQDQFKEELGVIVARPTLFCNPVDKNGEGILFPQAHLTCYEIFEGEEDVVIGGALSPFSRRPRRFSFPFRFPPRFPLSSANVDVLIENQFGTDILRLNRPELLCVPSAKIDVF